MTISINEIVNKNIPNFPVIKESQDLYVPNIQAENISKRNGMVSIFTGSGGSGKTNLLLNLFKNRHCYRNKFHNIYYFCPQSSFLSVVNHPFEKHSRVYHELTADILLSIYDELNDLKEGKNNTDSDDEDEVQYNCIVIDDFADVLKQKDIQRVLNTLLIKARHLRCAFIFTLQSYYYFPKLLRKQITYITIFKSKNISEFESIARELLNLNKEDALKLYNYIFDKNYNHLDLDTVENKVYKNYNLLNLEE